MIGVRCRGAGDGLFLASVFLSVAVIHLTDGAFPTPLERIAQVGRNFVAYSVNNLPHIPVPVPGAPTAIVHHPVTNQNQFHPQHPTSQEESAITALQSDPQLYQPLNAGVDNNFWWPGTKRDITILLYTREYNYPYRLEKRNVNNLNNSTFKTARPTKILIHGFGGSAEKPMIQANKDAYLSAMDVNVLAVDWKKLAVLPWYNPARLNARKVGLELADMIDWLVQDIGVDLSSFHIVGHSLGAHVAGVAGHNVKSGRIGRISGLDPAHPGYEFETLPNRLDPSDANFVDVVHTTSGWLGLKMPVGHVDWYPNKGLVGQPGCTFMQDIYGRCSHNKAHVLFRETLSRRILANKCDSLEDALNGVCNGEMGPMGEKAIHSLPGIYYAPT